MQTELGLKHADITSIQRVKPYKLCNAAVSGFCVFRLITPSREVSNVGSGYKCWAWGVREIMDSDSTGANACHGMSERAELTAVT